MKYITVKNNQGEQYRVGLIHHIWSSEKTILSDDDLPKKTRIAIEQKFEELEAEVYEIIKEKRKEFDAWLDKNNLKSSMGSIGRKSIPRKEKYVVKIKEDT